MLVSVSVSEHAFMHAPPFCDNREALYFMEAALSCLFFILILYLWAGRTYGMYSGAAKVSVIFREWHWNTYHY